MYVRIVGCKIFCLGNPQTSYKSNSQNQRYCQLSQFLVATPFSGVDTNAIVRSVCCLSMNKTPKLQKLSVCNFAEMFVRVLPCHFLSSPYSSLGKSPNFSKINLKILYPNVNYLQKRFKKNSVNKKKEIKAEIKYNKISKKNKRKVLAYLKKNIHKEVNQI